MAFFVGYQLGGWFFKSPKFRRFSIKSGSLKTEQFNRPVLHKRYFCNSQPGHNEDGVAEMPMKRASPLLDDSPPLGCRGRIWETYIILTQMDCKPTCDARVETTVSSLYIATYPQVTHFLTLWRLLLGVHFCPPITIWLQNCLGCYGMPYFKGSYIEASFFKTTLNFRHCHCCKVSPSIGYPMDRRYFNQEATSAIFSKNFLTNFFFGLLFGLSRCLPIRGTIFRKP